MAGLISLYVQNSAYVGVTGIVSISLCSEQWVEVSSRDILLVFDFDGGEVLREVCSGTQNRRLEKLDQEQKREFIAAKSCRRYGTGDWMGGKTSKINKRLRTSMRVRKLSEIGESVALHVYIEISYEIL